MNSVLLLPESVGAVAEGWEQFAALQQDVADLKPEVKDVSSNTSRTQAAERAKMLFLFVVTLTFDFDFQTLPNEGTITSSVWIWRKSVQQFPRYTNKKVTDSAKNRTLRSSLRAVMTSSSTLFFVRNALPSHTEQCDWLFIHCLLFKMTYV